MGEIGLWMKNYSEMFLSDSYLKYVGWTLHDKVSLRGSRCWVVNPIWVFLKVLVFVNRVSECCIWCVKESLWPPICFEWFNHVLTAVMIFCSSFLHLERFWVSRYGVLLRIEMTCYRQMHFVLSDISLSVVFVFRWERYGWSAWRTWRVCTAPPSWYLNWSCSPTGSRIV